LQEKVFKVLITDLDELKQRLRTEWAMLHGLCDQLRQPFVSSIVNRSRPRIFLHAVFKWIKICRIWRA